MSIAFKQTASIRMHLRTCVCMCCAWFYAVGFSLSLFHSVSLSIFFLHSVSSTLALVASQLASYISIAFSPHFSFFLL